jgi:hypothetical protein
VAPARDDLWAAPAPVAAVPTQQPAPMPTQQPVPVATQQPAPVAPAPVPFPPATAARDILPGR